MNSVTVVSAVLSMLAGIGIFLVACSMMSSNLEAVSSSRLRSLFKKVSGNKLIGVGIGAVTTAAIQSSGATTVMVIGFVNAGIMSLVQAATVIYGANIGTTITGQIVALGMTDSNMLSTTVIFSAFAGVGAMITLFSKKDQIKRFGGIFSGFGMLFVGLSMMSSSMGTFSELDVVKEFLAGINNAVLLVIVGTVFTAIIQSSSVMTSIAITMVVTGLITLDQGIFLTMGSNIGSCVVAMIAGLGSGKNAKRTALIHLLFNVGGVLLFMTLDLLLAAFTGGSASFGTIFEYLFPRVPQVQLAMFHTVFNVLTVVLFLPLTGALVKLVAKIVPEREEENKEESKRRLYYVDRNMLKTPPIAVAQLKKEIINMADIAMRNYICSLDTICKLDFSKQEQFKENEAEIDYINKELVKFVVELSKLPLSEKDHKYVSTTFHTISDLERVGDYAENIMEYADTLKKENQGFSESAIYEIAYMREHIEMLFAAIIKAYTKEDHAAFEEADRIEDKIDRITARMEENHIIRLNQGICTAIVGSQYMSLASNSERIADHLINMGKMIKEW
ncbi:MAG: Na/Pi cotransporter family protein [Lachnospiraceae bacterium]|nr:Na/Pi cotransporter family protein [Lachnospiraceae bacterium]